MKEEQKKGKSHPPGTNSYVCFCVPASFRAPDQWNKIWFPIERSYFVRITDPPVLSKQEYERVRVSKVTYFRSRVFWLHSSTFYWTLSSSSVLATWFVQFSLVTWDRATIEINSSVLQFEGQQFSLLISFGKIFHETSHSKILLKNLLGEGGEILLIRAISDESREECFCFVERLKAFDFYFDKSHE